MVATAEAGDQDATRSRRQPGKPATERETKPERPAQTPLKPDPAYVVAEEEAAERERARRELEREHTLSANEIQHVVFAYDEELSACYRDHALGQPRATGAMNLEIIIHRNGTLFRLEVNAPGVRGKQLDRCVRKVAESWRFPPRKGFTTAEVPFQYVRTRIPGAGPYRSCWNPRGCPRPPAAKDEADKVTRPEQSAAPSGSTPKKR